MIKAWIFAFAFVAPHIASAQIAREPLFRRPEPVSTPAAQSEAAKSTPKRATPSGNLPSEYRQGFRVGSENPVILPSRKPMDESRWFAGGDTVQAEITGGVIALGGMDVPVVAKVAFGRLKGGLFLGTAKMERVSKRVLLDFYGFRPPGSRQIEAINGVGQALDGKLGLEGELNTSTTKFLSAELLTGLAAAYSDSLVDRSVTPFGQRVDENSHSNAGKKALASAFSRSADWFSEQLKASPEFMTLDGPVVFDVIILPTENK